VIKNTSPGRTAEPGLHRAWLFVFGFIAFSIFWSGAGIVIASDSSRAPQARDVEFRATGNEPGWFLEISAKKQIVLVTDYGQKRYAFPDAKAPSDPHAQCNVLHAVNDEHRLEVILESKPCMDTMSDEQFDTRVTVRLNDRELRGCGRSLH